MEDFALEILHNASDGKEIGEAQEALRTLGRVFGLQLDTEGPEKRVELGWDKHLSRFKD
jgi:hypothetical protein